MIADASDPIAAMRAYIDGELARIKRDSEKAMLADLEPGQRGAVALFYTVEAQTLYFMALELDRVERKLNRLVGDDPDTATVDDGDR